MKALLDRMVGSMLNLVQYARAARIAYTGDLKT